MIFIANILGQQLKIQESFASTQHQMSKKTALLHNKNLVRNSKQVITYSPFCVELEKWSKAP